MKPQSKRTKKYRQSHYEKYAYLTKKHNAKRKGITFNLTFEQFKSVWKKGLHIDRINPLRGYEPDNIQALDPFENCSKGATYDKMQHAMNRNCPF